MYILILLAWQRVKCSLTIALYTAQGSLQVTSRIPHKALALAHAIFNHVTSLGMSLNDMNRIDSKPSGSVDFEANLTETTA